MKVTQEIRNYIEKKVRNAYANLLETGELLRREAQETVDKAMSDAKNAVANVLNTRFGDSIRPDDIQLYVSGRWSTYTSPELKGIIEKQREIDVTINEKVEEIVVELSLGGTKADIDRLISEINAEAE